MFTARALIELHNGVYKEPTVAFNGFGMFGIGLVEQNTEPLFWGSKTPWGRGVQSSWIPDSSSPVLWDPTKQRPA